MISERNKVLLFACLVFGEHVYEKKNFKYSVVKMKPLDYCSSDS